MAEKQFFEEGKLDDKNKEEKKPKDEMEEISSKDLFEGDTQYFNVEVGGPEVIFRVKKFYKNVPRDPKFALSGTTEKKVIDGKAKDVKGTGYNYVFETDSCPEYKDAIEKDKKYTITAWGLFNEFKKIYQENGSLEGRMFVLKRPKRGEYLLKDITDKTNVEVNNA
ncbi:MAG: hypothetical protein ABEK36_04475 [Candidatus Aenigmatarchaeota archaeon]